MRDRVPVTDYTMQIHPRDTYPMWNVTKGKRIRLPPSTLVHTTQKVVSQRRVDALRKRIRAGEEFIIEVGLLRSRTDPKKGMVWMYDGHHRLAAYRAEGLPAPAWAYETGHDVGGPTDAPHYTERK